MLVKTLRETALALLIGIAIAASPAQAVDHLRVAISLGAGTELTADVSSKAYDAETAMFITKPCPIRRNTKPRSS